MKENIVIIGTGEHARVVLYNALCQDKYTVCGFISEKEEEINQRIDGIPIIGVDHMFDDIIKEYNISGYILGMGDIKRRRILIDYYNQFENIKPVTIIHPHAVIGPKAIIGEGTLIECGCLVVPNPIIGKHCVINTMTGVNHDNVLGEGVYLASGVTLSGGVNIGDYTLIDDGVTITLGRKIGKSCIIGAGSVVTKDFEDNIIAYGIPAKPIRKSE